ncbi:hypothetical protein B0H21DRAFT_698826 [Amylocystis lapponica]|nr:hypothetical protein B0H21DRAFT_698826 [Amylocystis lapponica]
MPARYVPIPNPFTDSDPQNEMEAAFDDPDSDDDDGPLNTTRNGYHPLAYEEPSAPQPEHIPGTYDFENADYDYTMPPPGSPPGPSARALPNEWGNSNGLVPSPESVRTDAGRGRGNWFRRTAASVLPSHYVHRFGLVPKPPSNAVGGGESNDGVFANVTAKPSLPRQIQEGDETYLVPEETSKDAPPSYSAAQADAVPPYWETTIHAPSSSNNPGDVIIDALPTGSLFSFLWNMLVSVSFQFVGFLLTYLLHTTHAAKLGSRAGLGVTLIQYGFAMRGKDVYENQDGWNGWEPAEGSKPLFGTTPDPSVSTNGTQATPTIPPDSAPVVIGDATSEWLSFLLMTVGWFILLTSLLGFWRVKRWERGILTSQREAPPSPDERHNSAVIYSLERLFGMQGLRDGSLIRTGLGLRGSAPREQNEEMQVHVLGEAEEDEPVSPRGEYILPLHPDDPERNARIAQAYAVQARLHQDLRSAGLI